MPVLRDPANLESITLHKAVNLRDKTVLEIGCGDGRLTALYRETAQQVVGIDMATDALYAAQNSRTSKTHFACTDATCLPFRDNSFDVVLYAWSL